MDNFINYLKKYSYVKISGDDPYTEVGNIISGWCATHYHGDALVTLSIDGRVTTEYLEFNGNTMDFTWANDWWEGEEHIELIGFRMLGDVMFFGPPIK